MRGTNYRRDIQVLRGLAVLAVVLFHANESYFPLGYLGVDVFFVISGFVVIPLILRIFTDQANRGGRISNLSYFYKMRFYRLAPAAAVMLVITAVTIFLLGPISDHQRFAGQGISTLLLAGNFGAYRYSGEYFSDNPNPLVHTWSLSVEEQIYIFLPLVLMIFLHNRNRLIRVTAAVLGFILALSFISFLFPAILQPLYHRVGIELASQFSFYSPIDRIWQFSVGGFAFLLLKQYPNRFKKIPKSFHLLTVIAIVMILFGPIELNLKVGSIFASLIAITVITIKSLDVLPKILISQLEWIGDRSYSIYLVHMPLIYIAKYSPVTQIGSEENRIVQSTMAVMTSVLLGALSYSKIENRYRAKVKDESAVSRGTLRVFAFGFISPLTIFLLLSGFVGTTSTSMNKDRLDNGICKFWTPNLDKSFYSRFLNCYSKFGRATVVLGDSHAMNIFNSLFLTTKSEFFVGIAGGGCRPNSQSESNCFNEYETFLKSSPSFIKQIYFHQSGSYLISDKQGNVDTNLAFKSPDSYRIIDYELKFLFSYLNELGRKVDTTWIGPFPELRVDPTWVQVKANQVKPNPIIKKAFLDLEKQINFYLNKENNTFRYISLSGILGDRQFEYKVGSCILFRDIDHWSKCGEEFFSIPISKSVK